MESVYYEEIYEMTKFYPPSYHNSSQGLCYWNKFYFQIALQFSLRLCSLRLTYLQIVIVLGK